MPAAERLGVYGGTFDPVHIAHLVAAVEARHALGLDRLLMVVAPDPWQKEGRVVAPAALRYEMLEAAVADVPGLEASAIELERRGPTYTIDTVEVLQANEPSPEVFLVVGADVASRIDTWHRANELRERVTLAIVERDGVVAAEPAGWRAQHVVMPRIDISSTDIRDRVAHGRPIDVIVPAGAVRVLRAHGLYTRP